MYRVYRQKVLATCKSREEAEDIIRRDSIGDERYRVLFVVEEGYHVFRTEPAHVQNDSWDNCMSRIKDYTEYNDGGYTYSIEYEGQVGS